MSVTSTVVPTGTWTVDPAHPRVGFAVEHMGIATVRGVFGEFSGTLETGDEVTAVGAVTAASVDTNEPQRDSGVTVNQALGSGTMLVSGKVKLALDVSAVRQA